MLMRTDPFGELDRWARSLSGTRSPAAMPIDAYRHGDAFFVHFDLPGVSPDSIDVTVEENALTVRAERPRPVPEDAEVFAAERPAGVFSRQLSLGQSIDTGHIEAGYAAGVLTLRLPVAEHAKPRRIEISTQGKAPTPVTG